MRRIEAPKFRVATMAMERPPRRRVMIRKISKVGAMLLNLRWWWLGARRRVERRRGVKRRRRIKVAGSWGCTKV